MTPGDRRRLVQLLGMLGSAHDGERANAGALADRVRHQLGLVWDDLIVASDKAVEPANIEAPSSLAPRELDIRDLNYLDTRWHLLTDRQRHWVGAFFDYLTEHECLSAKQREVLDDIMAKANRRRRSA